MDTRIHSGKIYPFNTFSLTYYKTIPIRLLPRHLSQTYIVANTLSIHCAYLTNPVRSTKMKMLSSAFFFTLVTYSIHILFAVKSVWLRCEPSRLGHPLIISQALGQSLFSNG